MLAFASVAHAAAQGNPEGAPINAFVRQWLSDIVPVRASAGNTSSPMQPCSSQLLHRATVVPFPSRVTGSPTPRPGCYPAMQPATNTSTSHRWGFLPPTPFDGSAPMPTSSSWYASSHVESLAAQRCLRRPLRYLQLPRSAGMPMRPPWHQPPPPPPRHGADGCKSLPSSVMKPLRLRSPSPSPLWRKVESEIRRSSQRSSISGSSSCPPDAMSSLTTDAGSSSRSSLQLPSEEDKLSRGAASAHETSATPPARDREAPLTTSTPPVATVAWQLAHLMQSGEAEHLVDALRAAGLELIACQGRAEEGREAPEPIGRSSPTAQYQPMRVLISQAKTAENRNINARTPPHEARPYAPHCLCLSMSLFCL
jgi:hypothetical protein